MRVHMFQGEDGLYGFTPRDDGSNLPAEYSPWRPLKSVKVIPDCTAPRIGANETEVLAAIKRQGYCITDVRIEIKETPAEQSADRLMPDPDCISSSVSIY
jgi:hypothetical protein